MTAIRSAGALALALLLAACGEQALTSENRENARGGPEANTTADVYSGTGTVQSIAGDQVTISHGPVEGLGWPAMTMSFKAASAEILSGVGVGDQISFSFTADGSAYTLTWLSKD